MLVNHNIKNFSGGVSQQEDENRHDNQVESMDNFQVTVAEGLRKRNPLALLSAIPLVENHTVHTYDRGDGLEKYGMILDATNGLRVYDVNGTAKTVNNLVYLTKTVMEWWTNIVDFKKDVRFLTVGDTTWLLNKKQTVSESASTVSTAGSKAFVWFKRSFDDGAGGGYEYKVNVNGTICTVNNTKTTGVASSMATQISAIANITATAVGSIVMIEHATKSPFTFSYSDSWGNQATYGWYTQKGTNRGVAKIGDLPSDMHGFTEAQVGVIPIVGTDRNDFTNYYLSWDGANWRETVGLEQDSGILFETMPAKIVRQTDGSFSFGFNVVDAGHDGFEEEWMSREKGDSESSPTPSFVGRAISNMFFFKNRLGFTSEESVILSATGNYYDFYRSTVIDILDSDPIDSSVDSNTVSILRNVNTVAGALTLWADDAQFLLSGGEILSPATTRISQTSSYSSDNSLAPVVLDSSILFFNRVGGHLDVLMYEPATLQADKSTAESITSHLPTYIPSTIDMVEVSSAHNMVFMHDSVDKKSLYVYKYHINAGEKIISAWFKWTFATDMWSIAILDGMLYLMASDSKVYKLSLEPIDISSNFLDADTGLAFTSSVVMSRYNVELSNEVRAIRQPFYIKNIKSSTDGMVDMDIINSERASTTTIKQKFLSRRLFVGGNSEKINIGFSSSYDTGCQINTVSIEGRFSTKSKNI